MPHNSDHKISGQLNNSRLQSVVLDYKRTQKLAKCGVAAIAVILVLILIFSLLGWNILGTSHSLNSIKANATANAEQPHIGENGNWFIGDKDTGVSASGNGAGGQGTEGPRGTDGNNGANGDNGKDGKDGLTPYIGENGNWFIGDKDTGISAVGNGLGSNQGQGGDSSGDRGNASQPGGEFTVKLDPAQGDKAIAVSETRGFANPTNYLATVGINSAWNITLADIPESVDSDFGGANNGKDYFSYTFFLKNIGTQALDYNELLTLDRNELDAVKALRFSLYRDGRRTIYASPAADGSKESFACDESFTGDVNLMSKDFSGLQPGQIVRYTVVVWFEGNDPECIDNILGGSVKLSLGFKVL